LLLAELERGARELALARTGYGGNPICVAIAPAERRVVALVPATVELRADPGEVVERAGVVAATSANVHGGPDPRSLDEVPEALRQAAGALIDAGQLPGTASTVLDLTEREPVVLREGAVPAAEALSALAAALPPVRA
jgi:hypothetical protein